MKLSHQMVTVLGDVDVHSGVRCMVAVLYILVDEMRESPGC